MAINFNQESFEKEIIKGPGLILVDFWAPWCPPCRILGPVIEKLAEEYKDKVKIGKVNIDENKELAEKYQVMSVPTMIFFKEGKEIEKLLGAQPEGVIKEKVDSLL